MAAKWLSAIAGAAPALARALGGPVAAAAPALAAVSRALLGKETADPGEVATLIEQGLSAEQVAALQTAEREFTLKLVDASVRLEEVEAGDRANARQREVNTHDWTPRTIAIAIMLVFFGLLVCLLVFQIPERNQRPFDILVGMLGGGVTTVLAYYFGSSSSSRAKDTILGRVAQR